MEQHDNQEYVEDHILRRYKLVEKVGSGSYGHVWKVVCKKTKEIFALKKIFDAFRNVKDAQRTYREISILKKLQKHPNLVTLKEAIKAQNDRDIYLVFDYMECDLFSVIRENMLKQPHIRFITYQIAQALLFLHDCQILHRDLKPANILINSDCSVKLCDFGLSRFLSTKTGQQLNMTEFVATRWYRSPEIIFGSHQYRTETDLWSFGCIVGEMLSGKSMFSGKTILEQIEKILAFVGCPTIEDIQSIKSSQITQVFDPTKIKKILPSYWFKDVSEEGIDLVNKLLKFNPKERISLEEVLDHPFVKDFAGGTTKAPAPKIITCNINDNERWATQDYRLLVYQMIGSDKVELYPTLKRSFRHSRNSVSVLQRKKHIGSIKDIPHPDKDQQNIQPSTLLKESKSYWFSPKKSNKQAQRIYNCKPSLYHSPPPIKSPPNLSVISVKDQNRKQGEKGPMMLAVNRNDSRKFISIYKKIPKRKF